MGKDLKPQFLHRVFKLGGEQYMISVYHISDDPLSYRFVTRRRDAKSGTTHDVDDQTVPFTGDGAVHASIAVDSTIKKQFDVIEKSLSKKTGLQVTESRDETNY